MLSRGIRLHLLGLTAHTWWAVIMDWKSLGMPGRMYTPRRLTRGTLDSGRAGMGFAANSKWTSDLMRRSENSGLCVGLLLARGSVAVSPEGYRKRVRWLLDTTREDDGLTHETEAAVSMTLQTQVTPELCYSTAGWPRTRCHL